MECAGGGSVRSAQSADKPEVGGPAAVECDVVALVFHSFLHVIRDAGGRERAGAIYRGKRCGEQSDGTYDSRYKEGEAVGVRMRLHRQGEHTASARRGR